MPSVWGKWFKSRGEVVPKRSQTVAAVRRGGKAVAAVAATRKTLADVGGSSGCGGSEGGGGSGGGDVDDGTAPWAAKDVEEAGAGGGAGAGDAVDVDGANGGEGGVKVLGNVGTAEVDLGAGVDQEGDDREAGGSDGEAAWVVGIG